MTYFSSLKNRRYTGENRCLPCTIVNLAIGLVGGLVVSTLSPLAGLLCVFVSISLIYFRGYLVPGTPELTKKHLPNPILKLFGKDPLSELTQGDLAESPEEKAEELERCLHTLGVIQENKGLEQMELCEEFEKIWSEELDQIISVDDPLSVLLKNVGVTKIKHDDIRDGPSIFANEDGDVIGNWPSTMAIHIDLATERAIDRYSKLWSKIEPEQRLKIIASLRIFVARCPNSGGKIITESKTVETCCSSYEVGVISCEKSGEIVAEQPLFTN